MIEVKRKVKKEVEEVINMELVPYWVIRVVRVGGYNNKEVLAEHDYNHMPNEQEIAQTLVEHEKKKVFASVVKNYRLVEVDKG